MRTSSKRSALALRAAGVPPIAALQVSPPPAAVAGRGGQILFWQICEDHPTLVIQGIRAIERKRGVDVNGLAGKTRNLQRYDYLPSMLNDGSGGNKVKHQPGL